VKKLFEELVTRVKFPLVLTRLTGI